MSRVLSLVVSGLLIAVVAGGSPPTADARGGGKSQMGQGQKFDECINLSPSTRRSRVVQR